MKKFEFNKNLKEIRTSYKYTQKDICNILKCSQNKYASYEQGRTEPDIETLRTLCMIFNISADEILGL